MRDKKILFILIGFVFIIGLVNISAVCCEKLKEGQWCIAAENVNQCDSNYNVWQYKNSCLTVPECMGTCINPQTGECSESTPKASCLKENNNWVEQKIEEVAVCKKGCCTIGLDTYFVTQAECRNMFTEYNIQGTFNANLGADSCLAQNVRIKKGACVIGTGSEKKCIITSNTLCNYNNVNELSKKLVMPFLQNEISVNFYENKLCTATLPNGEAISECAKTQNTVCSNEKVYYIDTCGNLANIFDSSKYNSINYWTDMKNRYDDICKVGASGSSTCGNCDPTMNTVCKSYKEDSGASKPSNNDNGLICGSLSCKYEGRVYQHGESWCAESPGTLIIHQNLTTGKLYENDLKELKNASKYNLPGSRYYKLVCSSGVVLVEECEDYRREVCIQGVDDYSGRSEASCSANPYMKCTSLVTKTDCEKNILCKWIPGYTWNMIEIVPKEYRKEMQGSCVSLVAPGFDFWNGTKSMGSSICAMGTVGANALFETSIWRNRDNIKEWDDLHEKCINECYAIPGYGKEFPFNGTKIYPEDVKCKSGAGVGGVGCSNMYSVLTKFYDKSNFELPDKVKTYTLSTRKGQYCHKYNKPDKWVTGKVTGYSYDCTPVSKNEERTEAKTRDYPIFLTNQEFIMSITERTKSLGDCGYKTAVNGAKGILDAEIITYQFWKVKQDMTTEKKKVGVEMIIYKGDGYISEEKMQNSMSEIPASVQRVFSCSEVEGRMCVPPETGEFGVCGEAGQEADGTCQAGAICCEFEGYE